jgi:hypothetical protein
LVRNKFRDPKGHHQGRRSVGHCALSGNGSKTRYDKLGRVGGWKTHCPSLSAEMTGSNYIAEAVQIAEQLKAIEVYVLPQEKAAVDRRMLGYEDFAQNI